MKLLALTLTAMLCAVLLHQTTGAATGRTEEQRLLVSALKQLNGQLRGNSSRSSWFPGHPSVQVDLPKTHGATSTQSRPLCFKCMAMKVDGTYLNDDSKCDLDPESAETTICDSCAKMVVTEKGNGHTVRSVVRDCLSVIEGSTIATCLTNTEVSLSGKLTTAGQTVDISIFEGCCAGYKCNGTPSVNHTSKVFVSILGLLLTVFYSY